MKLNVLLCVTTVQINILYAARDCYDNKYCNDRGRCIALRYYKICTCNPSYFGPRCQYPSTCFDLCRWPKGCTFQNETVSCNCENMYTGRTCFDAQFVRPRLRPGNCYYHIDHKPWIHHGPDTLYCERHGSVPAMIKNAQQLRDLGLVVEEQIPYSRHGLYSSDRLYLYIGIYKPSATEKFWTYRDNTLIPFQRQNQRFPQFARKKHPSFTAGQIVILATQPKPTNVEFLFWTESKRERQKGVVCEKYLNGTPCGSNPCMNGGTCHPIGCSYTCSCKRGYKERNCETPIFHQYDNASSSSCEYYAYAREYNSYVTFLAATRACEEMNATLVIIKNNEEQRFIEEIVRRRYIPPIELWIGASQTDTGYKLNDGEIVSNQPDSMGYPRWGKGKPSASKKSHILITTTEDSWEYRGLPTPLFRPWVMASPAGKNVSHPLYWTDADQSMLAGYVCERISRNIMPCDNSPCQNGGTCNFIGCSYVCSCPEDFTGRRCEKCSRSPCDSSPCGNGAVCKVSKTCSAQYTCECDGNYVGSACVCKFEPCQAQPCQNGGTCRRVGCSMNYTCSCLPSFSGTNCEEAAFVLSTSGFKDCSYHFSSALDTSNYTVASATCLELNASLAQIKSETVQLIIDSIAERHFGIKSEVALWLGAQYINGTWLWLDGAPLTKSKSDDFPRWGQFKPESEDVKSYLLLSNSIEISGSASSTRKLYWSNYHDNIEIGLICERLVYGKPCDNFPCQHEGTCQDVGCYYTCHCPQPYVGGQCEIAPPELITADPHGYVFKATFTLSCTAKGIPVPKLYWKIMKLEQGIHEYEKIEVFPGTPYIIENDVNGSISSTNLTMGGLGLLLGRCNFACAVLDITQGERLLHEFTINPVTYHIIKRTYYTLSRNIALSGDEARQACHNAGGNLASIRDDYTYDAILKLRGYHIRNNLSNTREAWIGLRRNANGAFEWPNGDFALYVKWDKNEPSEMCSYITGSEVWKTAACSGSNSTQAFQANFICEFPDEELPKILHIYNPFGVGNTSEVTVKWKPTTNTSDLLHRVRLTHANDVRFVDVIPEKGLDEDGNLNTTVTGLKPGTKYGLVVIPAPSVFNLPPPVTMNVTVSPSNTAILKPNGTDGCTLTWKWPSSRVFPVFYFVINVYKHPLRYSSGTEASIRKKIADENISQKLPSTSRKFTFRALPNRNHIAEVIARSSRGNECVVEASGKCITSDKGGLNVPSLSVSSGGTLISFVPEDQTQSPVSCYFIIAVYHHEQSQYELPYVSKRYLDEISGSHDHEEIPAGQEYIALAIPSQSENYIAFDLGNEEETVCNVLDFTVEKEHRREGREAKDSDEYAWSYKGRNRKLISKKYYTWFAVSSYPIDDHTVQWSSGDPITKYIDIKKEPRLFYFYVFLGVFASCAIAVGLACAKRNYHFVKKGTLFVLDDSEIPNEKFDELQERLDSTRLPEEDVERLKLIEMGTAADYWKARVVNDRLGDVLAFAKIVTGDEMSQRQRRDFAAEVQTMHSIGKHHNLVQFYGLCSVDRRLMLVMEYLSEGDLHSFLVRNRPEAYYDEYSSLSKKGVGSIQLVKFSLQTARGMEHLVEVGIVHRSLCCVKILLSGTLHCKVAGFGTARQVNPADGCYIKDDMIIDLHASRWMAPEAFFDHTFSCASDAWSFGVTIWEIFALGHTPLYELSESSLSTKSMRLAYNLSCPKHCPAEMYNIMETCWNPLPMYRSHFKEIRASLEKFLKRSTMPSLMSLSASKTIQPRTYEEEQELVDIIPDSKKDDSEAFVPVHGNIEEFQDNYKDVMVDGEDHLAILSDRSID